MAESHSAVPISYTPDEVGKTFMDMLATFDFAVELRDLNIGAFSLFKRRHAKQLVMALYIALWHVALEKSFPNDAQTFFTHFVNTWPYLQGTSKRTRSMRGLIAEYDALVSETKDTDFSHVADRIADLFTTPATDRAKLQRKLSLRIRTVYNLIFSKLIPM